MYTPVATDSLKISPVMERYLLGTKKTTKVVANPPMCVGGRTGQREGEKFKDTLNLVREDRLLAVKKEELLEEKRSQQMASEIKSER